MSDASSSRFERMFNNLFELIRDSTRNINNLTNEVGKARAGVNEFIQIIRNRPCFEKQMPEFYQELLNKSIDTIQTLQDTYEKDSIEKTEAFENKLRTIQSKDNNKLVTIIYVLIGVNTSVLCIIMYFIATNPQIWALAEKLLIK